MRLHHSQGENTMAVPEGRILGQLTSLENVVTRPTGEPAQDILRRLPSLFGRIRSEGRELIEFEYNFRRRTGSAIVVETGQTDRVVYAFQPAAGNYCRYVLNRESQPTNWIAMILARGTQQANTYVLIDAWTGRLS